MNSIKIAYLNVRGLTADKWDKLIILMNIFDILFLSETWYIDQVEHLSHPFAFASTIPSKTYTTGRQHHGLLCLCSHQIRTLISYSHTTEFSILLSISSQNILAVYTPPGLSNHQFLTVLKGSRNPSIIIGDLNV